MVNKVFLDTNILMEVIFSRKKSQECLDLILSNLDNIYISVLSIHICNYFLEKEGDSIQESALFFNQFNRIDLTEIVLQTAYNIYTKDFEDAVQVASFLQSQGDEFWTLDKKLEQNYEHVANIKLL